MRGKPKASSGWSYLMINDNYYEKANFRALIEDDEIGRVEERLNIIEVF